MLKKSSAAALAAVMLLSAVPERQAGAYEAENNSVSGYMYRLIRA